MRNYLPLLLIFLTITTAAQHAGAENIPVVLNQLPKEGILLVKGWKYQAGDNPAYAVTAYDDSKWQPIDPSKDIHDLPQLWKGVGWLRLHFTIDSSIIGSLVMEVQQSGASEIYLNGKLLHRMGIVSANPNAVKAFSPDHPLSLSISRNTEQVLAVRYALQPHIQYSTHFGTQNVGLTIRVNTIENGGYQYPRKVYDAKRNMFMVGLFAILCILYLAFYLFNHTQKVNLLFSVYAFIQAISWSGAFGPTPYVQSWFWSNNFGVAIQVLSSFFLITAIYRLLKLERGWIFYFLITLGIISIPIGAFFYGWGWNVFGLLFTNLVNIEITRTALKAVRNDKKGAWIIAAGGISYLALWLLFTLQWYGIFGAYGIDTFTLAWISIPVAVSIYLGYDFAITYRSLQQKLTEVERLSQEKQHILASQKEILEQQVTERTAALNRSLQELRATQAQLVQREKMASLGELTAGIAHEIQNPLNFVNNFSEINAELIDELKQEAQTGNTPGVIQLADELKENEQKIATHGKRADAIVKGMLQHSRTSTAEKELTDINALVEEYLRLSYHGLLAKDKRFEAQLQTEFDNTLSQIEVVRQDLGRVLLNLFNNAFYATAEKKKRLDGTYAPVVSVRTKRSGEQVEIQVQDNGTGIPKKVQDKIFQPFFTTKPTGEGTGLGLSLSYDMITKGNSGELTVQSEEGEGATFTVRLPL